MASIESDFLIPITYEDPPYVHSSDVVDITDPARATPGGPKELVPRSSSFSFTYDAPGTNAAPSSAHPPLFSTPRDGAQFAEAEAAIKRALKAYAATKGAQTFTVVQDAGRFNVMPTQIAGKGGALEPVKPILGMPVSIFPKERSGFDLLTEICQSLSSTTGTPVILGAFPGALYSVAAGPFTATTEPARSVIGRFLSQMPVPLSWQLFYDPGLKWYVLNIHPVRPPATVKAPLLDDQRCLSASIQRGK